MVLPDSVFARNGGRMLDPMQRFGACITYLPRYLYMTALNIAEFDAIDCMEQPESEERITVTVSAPSKPKAQSKAEEDDDNVFLDHYINGTDMPVRKSTSTNTAMAWAMMANMQRIYRTRGFDFL